MVKVVRNNSGIPEIQFLYNKTERDKKGFKISNKKEIQIVCKYLLLTIAASTEYLFSKYDTNTKNFIPEQITKNALYEIPLEVVLFNKLGSSQKYTLESFLVPSETAEYCNPGKSIGVEEIPIDNFLMKNLFLSKPLPPSIPPLVEIENISFKNSVSNLVENPTVLDRRKKVELPRRSVKDKTMLVDPIRCDQVEDEDVNLGKKWIRLESQISKERCFNELFIVLQFIITMIIVTKKRYTLNNILEYVEFEKSNSKEKQEVSLPKNKSAK
eukprot:snap_masked-scaffold_9-processed-gene-5.37-mRNA-1 protein AED:1.00 eAED:1.00 QI:0/0/0/0/1/1/3/0/269